MASEAKLTLILGLINASISKLGSDIIWGLSYSNNPEAFSLTFMTQNIFFRFI